jgi:putative membrane protein
MITYILARTVAILAASYITGVGVPIAFVWQTGMIALLVALFLAVINHTIKPIIVLLAMPITMFTMGFFSLVINGVVILSASYAVPGFDIPSFLMAVYFSIVLSILNWVLHMLE